MGTVFSIAAPDSVDPELFERAWQEACELLGRIEDIYSPFIPDSPVSRIRDGRLGPADLDNKADLSAEEAEDFREVLGLCAQLRRESDGAFDAWVVGDPPNFDPCGAVKGWAAERASDLLVERGVVAHLLNAGGDVRLRTDGVATWSVGVEDPHRPDQIIARLEVAEGAVATLRHPPTRLAHLGSAAPPPGRRRDAGDDRRTGPRSRRRVRDGRTRARRPRASLDRRPRRERAVPGLHRGRRAGRLVDRGLRAVRTRAARAIAAQLRTWRGLPEDFRSPCGVIGGESPWIQPPDTMLWTQRRSQPRPPDRGDKRSPKRRPHHNHRNPAHCPARGSSFSGLPPFYFCCWISACAGTGVSFLLKSSTRAVSSSARARSASNWARNRETSSRADVSWATAASRAAFAWSRAAFAC